METDNRREQASEAVALPPSAIAGAATAARAELNGAGDRVSAESAEVEPVEEADAASAVVALSANPEDTNVWPTAAEEAAFLSDARVRGEPVVPVARAVAEDAEEANDKAKLPKLEELVNRIPAETRELLDELFRAKFVAVRRVKKSDLKG